MTKFDDWDDSQPIYRQLRDKIAALIMEGALPEGEAIPSVRQVASEYRINHLTVSKSYQELVDEGLIQKRRGLGMFVEEGAKEKLAGKERNRFLNVEIPELLARMESLGISRQEFIELLNKAESDQ